MIKNISLIVIIFFLTILIITFAYFNNTINSNFIQKTSNNLELDTNLKITDLIQGSGAKAKNRDTVNIKYIGRLKDDTVFEDSYADNLRAVFKLGEAQVIRGWDQGIIGMKVGGKRRLIIPPDLAYGDEGTVGVPPNSTLIFDIELIDIK
ncbi:MAG: FKBP-type peptidyl-prolyl cis-trans isomerase [Candidatus Shapirobacteria bacterium]